MCGRFTQPGPATLASPSTQAPAQGRLDFDAELVARPGGHVIVRSAGAGDTPMERMRWGVVPPWAVRKGQRRPIINARCETVHTRATFRDAFAHRRCLAPASAWTEWSTDAGGRRTEWRIACAHTMAFAAVWMVDESEEAHEPRCVILTRDAHRAIATIHHRQPVIVHDGDAQAWLDPGAPDRHILDIAHKPMMHTPVARRV